MKYYIDTIEQIPNGDSFTEYGSREKKNDEQSALTAFYQKLSNVSADIGKGHTFMNIKITDSIGTIVKYDQIGVYHEDT